MDKPRFDTEYHAATPEKHRDSIVPDETGAVPGEVFSTGNSFYARFQRLVGRFGVEQRGIERVPENERTDRFTWKPGTMWCAANMVVSTFAIGALAVPVFALGFVDALLTILFFNLLGVMSVCFFSTFGPVFGMRQMVLSRYWFGYYGVKVIAFFNCLACIGWSAVNTIVGAQLLHAVNPNFPGWAGVVVIAIGTFIITLFGYKVVHMYESVAWIPCFIIFLIVLGEFAAHGHFTNIPMGVGSSEAASVLSFGASVFGYATGWTSYAADYTCYQPVGASRIKIFFWVFVGLVFPLCFTEMLGLAVATATTTVPEYATSYKQDHIGGLLAAVLFPPLGGFGKFCLVVLALSIVGNNCPNIYSLGFSLQILSPWTQLVPRALWTLIGTAAYIAIAIPGYSHFVNILENFMLVIAYWLAIYEAVALSEHFIYKRSVRNYDATSYDQPKKLPPSLAALAAFCAGIVGAAMGMAQVWFVGPIGKSVGGLFGGDVGFELAFAFAAAVYIPLRYVEKKKFGR